MTVAFTPSAPLVVYRNEIVLGFQRRQKLLYNSVLTQFQAKGYQAVFEVADTGNDYAVTRGANGFVPSSTFTQAQYTATMQMQFAKDVRNKEDILGSQGDIERVMTEAAIGKINRSIDKVILDQLDAGSQTAWSSAPLTSISTDTFVPYCSPVIFVGCGPLLLYIISILLQNLILIDYFLSLVVVVM